MNFQTAIQEADVVLTELDGLPSKSGNNESEQAKFDRSRLDQFLSTEEGARGFFVVLLTGNYKLADEPPTVLIEALNAASEAALGVLVKNLVMSSATEVVHKRNGDTGKAAGSRQVVERTANLFEKTKSTALRQKAEEMRDTLQGKSDAFAAFFGRVNYDDEQKQVALKALNSVLS